MSLHKLKSLKGGFIKTSKNKNYDEYDDYRPVAKKKKKIERIKEVLVIEEEFQYQEVDDLDE
jgi:hypothetical protein